jgi:hypothetical protein
LSHWPQPKSRRRAASVPAAGAGSTRRLRRPPASYLRLSGLISELAAMQFRVAEIFATLIPLARFSGAACALYKSSFVRINKYAIYEVLRCAFQYVSTSVDMV